MPLTIINAVCTYLSTGDDERVDAPELEEEPPAAPPLPFVLPEAVNFDDSISSSLFLHMCCSSCS